MQHTMTDVVILCGGLGTRLRPVVQDRPKPMALINGRPFLDLVIDSVLAHGLRRIVFCTGHHGDWIAQHVSRRTDCEAIISQEQTPLGTAGALRACGSLLTTPTILVLNGDSLCRIDLQAFLTAHHTRQALATMAVVPSNERTDAGGVTMDAGGRIRAFQEKQTAPYLNAGIYAMQKLPIDAVPDVTPNQVQILTNSPGLGPVEVEKFITFPVETALSGLPGITLIRSVSRFGLSAVTVYFEEGMDIYFCRRLVMERLPRARPR